MHCVNTAYFPWNIGFTFLKMAFKLSFGSLTEHVENSEKEIFASFNYKYFIIITLNSQDNKNRRNIRWGFITTLTDLTVTQMYIK